MCCQSNKCDSATTSVRPFLEATASSSCPGGFVIDNLYGIQALFLENLTDVHSKLARIVHTDSSSTVIVHP